MESDVNTLDLGVSGEFEGIVDKIDKNLHEGVLIGENGGRRQVMSLARSEKPEGETSRVNLRCDFAADDIKQVVQGIFFQIEGGVMVGQTSQLQYIGNKPRQTLTLKKDKIVIRLPSGLILYPAGPQHLSVHADGSQGCAEFVADC